MLDIASVTTSFAQVVECGLSCTHGRLTTKYFTERLYLSYARALRIELSVID